MKDAKSTNLIGAVVMLVVLMLGYNFVASPILAKKSEHEKTIIAAQDDRDRAQLEFASAQQFQDIYQSVKGVDKELSVSFPTTAAVESLTRTVTSAASRAGIPGIDIKGITTSAPVIMAVPVAPVPADTPTDGASGPIGTAEDTAAAASPVTEDLPAVAPPTAGASKLASITVSISIVGDADALVRFISYLRESDRVIKITGTTLSIGADRQGTLSIQGVSYLYQTIDDPNSTGGDPGLDPTQDPGLDPTQVLPTVAPQNPVKPSNTPVPSTTPSPSPEVNPSSSPTQTPSN